MILYQNLSITKASNGSCSNAEVQYTLRKLTAPRWGKNSQGNATVLHFLNDDRLLLKTVGYSPLAEKMPEVFRVATVVSTQHSED